MRRSRLFSLLTLMIILAVALLAGCKKKDKIASISLKDHDPEAVVEISAGGFDCSAYTLVVTYESGNTEELALSEDMISHADLFSLYQVGEHDITISYEGCTCTLKLNVKRSSFEGLSFPESNVFVYDGSEHTVEVEGDLPANATVTYPTGNSFINAGTYDVTAVISCDGYTTETLSTTVKIERAVYDMTGITFEPREFVYDGQEHSVEISGQLPEGVRTPTYMINERITAGATEVDVYTVRAIFANDNPNYEPIPEMQTTLTITPADYVLRDVDIVFKKENGRVISSSKVYDGESVIFDLNDYSKLSTKVAVSFFVYDELGTLISTSNRDTKIKNAGVYTVKAEFTLSDTKNYNPIDPIISTFEIARAEHPPVQNIQLISAQTAYNGGAHSLAIEGELPEGITVSYEYYLGAALVVDGNGDPVQSVTNAGRYTVKAVFSHSDVNLGGIASLSAILNIEKAKVDSSSLGVPFAVVSEYSGQPYELRFMTWQEANATDYDILSYGTAKYYMRNSLGNYVQMGANELPTEPGSYRYVITLSVLDAYADNYTMQSGDRTQEVSADFEIRKKQIEFPSFGFTSALTPIYTGAPQAVEFSCDADPDDFTLSVAYYRYSVDRYVAMASGDIPTNAGSYKAVVTLSINDTVHYVFASGEISREYTFEYDILKSTVDVSTLGISSAEFTYNGGDLRPSLTGLSDQAQATLTVYTLYGSDPLITAKDAGSYRIEVILAVKDAVNYELSSDEKQVFSYKIVPEKINVDGLEFGVAEFFYNGLKQYPELENIPEHVYTGARCFWGNDLNNNLPEYEGKRLAIDAGAYTCEIKLYPENSNYELVGQTTYTTEFVIKKQETDIDISAIVSGELAIPYATDGYTAEEIQNAIFGEISEHIDVTMNPIRIESGENNWIYPGEVISAPASYRFECRISVKDENAYVLSDGSELFLSKQLYIYFKIIKQLEVPTISFTSDPSVYHTGSGQAVEFDYDESLLDDCVISMAYLKYTADGYVPMEDGEIPTDVGKYQAVVTVAIKDAEHYAFADGTTSCEFIFELEIIPKIVIDVSSVSFVNSEFTYNGNGQRPTLNGLPDGAAATVTVYRIDGGEAVAEAVNAGSYRIVAVLAPTDPDSSLLSSSEPIELSFEILPKVVDVDGLEFDATEFYYNGKKQYPTLKNIPEGVGASVDCFWGNEENNNSENIDGKWLAIDEGAYTCKIKLYPENSNYVLEGPTTYTTEFVIEKQKTEIDISEIVSGEVELTYVESGYTAEAIQNAVFNAVFGEISELVTVTMNAPRIESGENNWIYPGDVISDPASYRIECRISVKDQNAYVLNDGSDLLPSKVMYIYFKIV